jgi:hypothetical protein
MLAQSVVEGCAIVPDTSVAWLNIIARDVVVVAWFIVVATITLDEDFVVDNAELMAMLLINSLELEICCVLLGKLAGR